MKRVLFLVGSLAVAGYAQAGFGGGCAIKEQRIASKLEWAKAGGHRGQVLGLTRALDNVRRYCRDDLRYGRYDDIADREAEVVERREELAEARRESQEKIEKRERKLARAMRELAEIKAE